MYDYMCVDYIYLKQFQLYLAHKGFENTKFNDISVIGITELLINIIYFHGFVKKKNTTAVLWYPRKLVSYQP